MAEPAIRIPLEPVTSSNLAARGYDPVKQILAIQFKSGVIFHYAEVSPETHARFMEAESAGRFYASVIRGQGPAERMTGPCASCGAEGWVGDKCEDCGTANHRAWTGKGEER